MQFKCVIIIIRFENMTFPPSHILFYSDICSDCGVWPSRSLWLGRCEISEVQVTMKTKNNLLEKHYIFTFLFSLVNILYLYAIHTTWLSISWPGYLQPACMNWYEIIVGCCCFGFLVTMTLYLEVAELYNFGTPRLSNAIWLIPFPPFHWSALKMEQVKKWITECFPASQKWPTQNLWLVLS